MKFVLPLLVIGALATPASAKNVAVPQDDPAATITIPNSWETSEIEYGYSAFSPGKNVYFSIETADAGSVDRMMKANDEWMKASSIQPKGPPQVSERVFNGLKGKVYHFDANDENGPTNVDFALLPISGSRIIFLTFWASDEEYDNHKSEIDGMIGSLKPIGQ